MSPIALSRASSTSTTLHPSFSSPSAAVPSSSTPQPYKWKEVPKLFVEILKETDTNDADFEALFKQTTVGLEVFRMKGRTFMVANYSNASEAEFALKSSAGKLRIVDSKTESQWRGEIRWTESKIFTRGWPESITHSDIIRILKLEDKKVNNEAHSTSNRWKIVCTRSKDDRVCAWLYNDSVEKIRNLEKMKTVSVAGHMVTLSQAFPNDEPQLLLTNTIVIAKLASEVNVYNFLVQCGFQVTNVFMRHMPGSQGRKGDDFRPCAIVSFDQNAQNLPNDQDTITLENGKCLHWYKLDQEKNICYKCGINHRDKTNKCKQHDAVTLDKESKDSISDTEREEEGTQMQVEEKSLPSIIDILLRRRSPTKPKWKSQSRSP